MFANNPFKRFTSILLCAIMLLNVFPAAAFASEDSDASTVAVLQESSGAAQDLTEGLPFDMSASVTLPPIIYAEQVPTFDHLYADEELVRGIDFSTKRLLVRTGDVSIFTWDTSVLSEYDGVYLLEFASADEAMSAYTYYYGLAEFVDPDLVMYAADN